MLYKSLIRPLLFGLDAEKAHRWALSALDGARIFPGERFLKALFGYEDPSLKIEAMGLSFENPVGLAAGFDKDALHLDSLFSLGFGFIEAGTATFSGQPGNLPPRIRRIPESWALWNHLGFNNRGALSMAQTLENKKFERVVGINVGKTKAVPVDEALEDYLASFKTLYPHGDYFVVNVSSPNTPDLRRLQDKDRLSVLLGELQKENKSAKPLLVKISPDLDFDRVDEIADLAVKLGLAGIVASNTTRSREGVARGLPAEGGVSGRPLAKRSTEIIRQLYRRAGKRACIIGCGGIFSAEDAIEKMKAGASLIQVYTGLIYEGPSLVKRIKQGLATNLKKNGMKSVSEAVGSEAS